MRQSRHGSVKAGLSECHIRWEQRHQHLVATPSLCPSRWAEPIAACLSPRARLVTASSVADVSAVFCGSTPLRCYTEENSCILSICVTCWHLAKRFCIADVIYIHWYDTLNSTGQSERPLLLYCTVLYCTVLYCTVLYCTVLYCTVLN